MSFFFFFNDTATTEIYTLSLHERSSDLAIECGARVVIARGVHLIHQVVGVGLGETRVEPRSEEHTSELQSQSNLVCRLLLEKNTTQESRVEHIIRLRRSKLSSAMRSLTH